MKCSVPLYHEFGHMLGLKHNPSSKSIMYFLDINGTEVLDSKDILDLSTHHKLRTAIVSTGFLPIKVVQSFWPPGNFLGVDAGHGDVRIKECPSP